MADLLWTSEEIAAATGGALAGAPFRATGVSIDTRTIEPGDLYCTHNAHLTSPNA